MIAQHARLAQALAMQLGLADDVVEALGGAYEQWDGRGWPEGIKGEGVPVASRLAQFAEFIEVAHRVGGVTAAVAMARRRRGKQFDPTMVAVFCDRADSILTGLDSAGAWEIVIRAQPALAVT